MPESDSPKIQKVEEQGLAALAVPKSQETSTASRSEEAELLTDKQQRKESSHQKHDKIAENHERLQNAGLEDTAGRVVAPQASQGSRTSTGTAPTSTTRAQQAFEDQRSAETTIGGRKRSRRRRYIPESIVSLVDILGSSLSEGQVQEILEQAIESRAKGTALEISSTELKEAAEAIFEEIRQTLANGDLANGDLAEVDELSEQAKQKIEEALVELFTEHEVELAPDELHWVSDLMRVKGRDHDLEILQEAKKNPCAKEFEVVSSRFEKELRFTPDLLTNESRFVEDAAKLLPSTTAWSEVLQELGTERCVRDLSTFIAHELHGAISQKEASEMARVLLREAVAREFSGELKAIANEELRAEFLEQECSLQKDFLTKNATLIAALPLLQERFESIIEKETVEIRQEVEKELLPLLALVDALEKECAKGAANERSVLELLRQIRPGVAPELTELFEERTGKSFPEHLKQVFGDRAHAIAEAINEENPFLLKILDARLLALQLEQFEQDERARAKKSGASLENLNFREESQREALKRAQSFVEHVTKAGCFSQYEALFGSAEQSFTKFEAQENFGFSQNWQVLQFQAQIRGRRNNDAAMEYAVAIDRSLRKDGLSEEGAILRAAKLLQSVPQELRSSVLQRVTEDLDNRQLQGGIENSHQAKRGTTHLLRAVVEGDETLKLVAQARIAEHDDYHSLVDFLKIYSLAQQNELSEDFRARYKELFNTDWNPLTLMRTQTGSRGYRGHQFEDPSKVSDEVWEARGLLCSQALKGEKLSPEALRKVIAHESRILAEATGEKASWRAEYSLKELEQERKELEEAAKVLAESPELGALIVDVAFSEAFFIARQKHISQHIWERVRVERFTAGAQGLSTEERRELRKSVENYLKIDMKVPEGELLDRMLEHHDRALKEFDAIFEKMKGVRKELYDSLAETSNWWSGHGAFYKVALGAYSYTPKEATFNYQTENRELKRDWGYSDLELRALEKLMPDITGGVELQSWIRRECGYEEFGDRAVYAFDRTRARYDYRTDRALEGVGDLFSRMSSEQLLQQIEKADPLTLGAIALKNAALSADPLPAVIELLVKPNAKAHLERFEKLHGYSFEKLLESDEFHASTKVILPPDREHGIERRVFDERTLLKNIVKNLNDPKLAGASPMTNSVMQDLHFYAIHRLSKYGQMAGSLEGGRLESRSLQHAAVVHYDERRLKEVLEQKKKFEAFINTYLPSGEGMRFSNDPQEDAKIKRSLKDAFESRTRAYKANQQRALTATVMLNTDELERRAEIATLMRDEKVIAIHLNASQSYSSTISQLGLTKESLQHFYQWENDGDRIKALKQECEVNYREAEKAQEDLHYALKKGWRIFGADDEKVGSTLRGLDAKQRLLACDLYEMKRGASVEQHCREEFEGDDAARVFAELYGDHRYADQIAIYQAANSWFGEAGVVGHLQRVAERVEGQARQELADAAHTLRLKALQQEALGENDAAKKLEVQAYRLEQAAKGEAHKNEVLQEKIEALQERFWDSFDGKFSGSGMDRHLLFEEEISESVANSAKAVLSEGTDPAESWRIRFEQALDDDALAATKVIEEERDQFLRDAITFDIRFSKEGELEGEILENGTLKIDGVEVTGEVIQQFYVRQLIEAEQQLHIQKQQLGNLSAEQREIALIQITKGIESVRTLRDTMQKQSFSEFASKNFSIEVKEGKEGDAVKNLLTLFVTDGAKGGTPGANIHLERFQEFVEQQKLVPVYRLSIAKGTVFTDHPELGAAWEARLKELDAVVQKAHNDKDASVRSLIEENAYGREKEWLLAELEGNLHKAAAYRVREDIERQWDDKIAVTALLPASLVMMQEELDQELEALEQAMPPELAAQYKARRKAKNERLLLETLAERASGERKEEFTKQAEEKKQIEERQIVPPEHLKPLSERYESTLQAREEVRAAVRERGLKIEELYNENFQKPFLYGRWNNASAGMWKDLAADYGQVSAEMYHSAVLYGELTDAMKLKISIDGTGTYEKMLFRALGDPEHGTKQRTRDELLALAAEYARLSGRDDLVAIKTKEEAKKALQFMQGEVVGDLDGDDVWRANVLFVGKPESVDQMKTILNIHQAHARGHLLRFATDWMGDEGERFDDLKEEFDTAIERAKKDGSLSKSEIEELRKLFVQGDLAAGSAVRERAHIGEMVVDGVSTTVVVVGSVVLMIPTGGTVTAITIGVMFTSRVGLSYGFKGSSYSGTQAAIDSGMVAFDVVTVRSGQFISAGVRRLSGRLVGKQALKKASIEAAEANAKTQGKAIAEQRVLRSVVDEGAEEVSVKVGAGAAKEATEAVQDTSLRYMAGQGRRGAEEYIERHFFLRTAESALDGGAQGGFDAFLIGAYQQGFEEGNWEHGFLAGLANMASKGGEHSVLGASFGAGAGLGFDAILRGGGGLLRAPRKIARRVRGIKEIQPDAPTYIPDEAPSQRFLSEIGIEESKRRLKEAKTLSVKAKEAGKSARTSADRVQAKVEQRSLKRTERAVSKANVDAEYRRHGLLDEGGMEIALDLRNRQIDLNVARSNRLAYIRQSFVELLHPKNGWSKRLDHFVACWRKAAKEHGAVRLHAKDVKVGRKALGRERKIAEKMTRMERPNDDRLRKLTRDAVETATRGWKNLRSFNLREGLVEFVEWRRILKQKFDRNLKASE
jgi:hypothetical protein